MSFRGGRTWQGTDFEAVDFVSVIDRLDAMWNAQYLDAVLEIFTDDAVVTVVLGGQERPKVITGRKQIRELLRPWLPGSTIRSRSHHVDGDRVIWISVASWDQDHRQDLDEISVKCEAEVRGDCIAMLTVTVHGQPQARLNHRSRHDNPSNGSASRQVLSSPVNKLLWDFPDVESCTAN